jgi:1,4-dihydroxy-2-naphthoate octaprenyltransferase
MSQPGKVALWFRAVRPFAYSASVIPVALGGLWAFAEGPINWVNFVLAVIAGVLFHTGTNLVNDYYDFKKGVDRAGTFGSSGVLVAGLMRPQQILRGGIFSFILGIVLGLYLVTQAGWPILVLGIIGFLGGFFYTAGPLNYKYYALGELGVFIMMGVLMVLGGYLVQNRPFDWNVLLFSLPIALLVAAILQANDIRDIANDRVANIKTMAMTMGKKNAGLVYDFMVVMAFVVVAFMVVIKTVSPWALLVLITLPLGIRNMKTIHEAHGEKPASLAMMDVATAQLHLSFGVLLCLGLLLARFVPF